MWIDHVTVALTEIGALDGPLAEMGLARRSARPLFDGTERSLVLLQDGFIELLAVTDRRTARKFTMGQAFLRFLAGGEGIFRVVTGVPSLDRFIRIRRAMGAQYWPPIDEQITDIGAEAVPIRMTQMDLMLPWVLEHRGARPLRRPTDPRFLSVEIQSADPASTAVQYRIALGCAIDEVPHGGSQTMRLENGLFRFVPGDHTGFGSLEIQGDGALLTVRVKSGHISGTVTNI